MQLYSAELVDTPTFQSHALLQLDTPTPVTLAPYSDQDGVWLGAGHTHWLLTVRGDDVAVSELGGVPLVGHCDVTGSADGQVWDVRLEATGSELTIAYHSNGERKVGGVYTMGVARGRPILVSEH